MKKSEIRAMIKEEIQRLNESGIEMSTSLKSTFQKLDKDIQNKILKIQKELNKINLGDGISLTLHYKIARDEDPYMLTIIFKKSFRSTEKLLDYKKPITQAVKKAGANLYEWDRFVGITDIMWK